MGAQAAVGRCRGGEGSTAPAVGRYLLRVWEEEGREGYIGGETDSPAYVETSSVKFQSVGGRRKGGLYRGRD